MSKNLIDIFINFFNHIFLIKFKPETLLKKSNLILLELTYFFIFKIINLMT